MRVRACNAASLCSDWEVDGGRPEDDSVPPTSTSTPTPTPTVTAETQTPPGVVTGLVVDESTSGQLTLTWNKPDDSGSAAITGYHVQNKRASDTAWPPGSSVIDHTVHADIATKSPIDFTVAPLVDGTTYDVRVQACNADGLCNDTWTEGSGTPGTTTTMPTVTAPGPVGNLTVTVKPMRLDVDWDAPSSDGGEAISHYEVNYRESTSTPWLSVSDVTATTTRISTGQTAGKTYHVQVRACNSPTRCSSWVESSGRTLGPVTAPGKVATPTVSIGKESLAIFWSAPSSDGGSAITGYDVQHKVNTAAWPADPVDDAGRIAGTDTTIRNLSNDTSYNVRVRACNANECGRWSDSASGTPAATALARPTGLNVVPIPRGLGNENGVVTARRALLSWDEVNGAEKYVIEESEDGVSWGEYTTVGQSTSKELVLDRLLFRTQVARFRVKAGKGQGRPPATIGDESAVVNVVDNPIVSIDGNSKDAGSNGPGVANIRWATVEGRDFLFHSVPNVGR